MKGRGSSDGVLFVLVHRVFANRTGEVEKKTREV